MDGNNTPIDRYREVEVDEEKDLVVFPKRLKLKTRKVTELGQYVGVDCQDRERNDDARN